MDFDALFTRIEQAVDAHPRLERVSLSPELRVSREGVSAHIRVRLAGSRKRPADVSGVGDTPEEAVESLVKSLDSWASVW